MSLKVRRRFSSISIQANHLGKGWRGLPFLGHPGSVFLIGHKFCNFRVLQSTEKCVTWSDVGHLVLVWIYMIRNLLPYFCFCLYAEANPPGFNCVSVFLSHCFYLQTNRCWRAWIDLFSVSNLTFTPLPHMIVI